jgi:hypothetical protein
MSASGYHIPGYLRCVENGPALSGLQHARRLPNAWGSDAGQVHSLQRRDLNDLVKERT